MQHLDLELSELKNKLLTMASHAENAVRDAVRAVNERDYELGLRVRSDDSIIDQYEVDVDEMAIQLLAKAPLATDLRFIAVAMKISQNLERVGDEATKIANRARELSQDAPLKMTTEISRMAGLSLEMLKGSLDAFVKRDAAAARALIPKDKEIDVMNKQLQRELAARMVSDPESITRCLSLMVVVKSLERIADHAKNVAEEVVYLCEAEDIRHTAPHAS